MDLVCVEEEVGLVWLSRLFVVQWRCSATAAGEPEVPQSADQPDARGRRRTSKEHSGEFNSGKKKKTFTNSFFVYERFNTFTHSEEKY